MNPYSSGLRFSIVRFVVNIIMIKFIDATPNLMNCSTLVGISFRLELVIKYTYIEIIVAECEECVYSKG